MNTPVRSYPVAFDRCQGVLTLADQDAQKDCAVLLLRPWGFDELCSRKFYRVLAESLTRAGLATLRFDYPGTGDSLDLPEGECLADWRNAALAAADRLRRETGCGQILLCGMGAGAIPAHLVAAERSDVAGMIYAAPVTNGRRYLRETALRSKMIVEGLGLPADSLPTDRLTIAGFALSTALADDFKSIRLDNQPHARKFPALVLERASSASDGGFAEHLAGDGHEVTRQPFLGYDTLMEDPTSSRVPVAAVETIVNWCELHATEMPAQNKRTAATPNPDRLAAPGFTEQAVFVGKPPGLYGVVCEPVRVCPSAPVVVFLNAGYDHHVGWGRAWVDAARDLARVGAVSLRLDLANIGDSAPTSGAPDQVLYTDGAISDISRVLDEITKRFDGPITLVGRCSGAYSAFHAGYRDPRISQLLLCNQVRLIWDPEESLTDASRMGPRSMGDYKKRLADPRTVRRLFAGQIDLRGVLRGLSIHAVTRASHALAPVLCGISKYARFRAECHAMFNALRARNVQVHFLCSEGDESLEQLGLYFGKTLSGLKAYPNVTLTRLPDADHNLTPDDARAALRAKLREIAALPADQRLSA
ncbi:MAG: hypothetical protein JJ902_00375 [Roseibium sp.]|nr:hypothetical protein [Roseibium sp.]